uniref:Uncharacterized protein n=1 Tax=Cacopsylla melanoneura TaxID=428564 RepID=A0A8D9EFB2_9HEMI
MSTLSWPLLSLSSFESVFSVSTFYNSNPLNFFRRRKYRVFVRSLWTNLLYLLLFHDLALFAFHFYSAFGFCLKITQQRAMDELRSVDRMKLVRRSLSAESENMVTIRVALVKDDMSHE